MPRLLVEIEVDGDHADLRKVVGRYLGSDAGMEAINDHLVDRFARPGETPVPTVIGMRVMPLPCRLTVPHLSVYVDVDRGDNCYMADMDLPDDEHGIRVPGNVGQVSPDPALLGEWVASELVGMYEAAVRGQQAQVDAPALLHCKQCGSTNIALDATVMQGPDGQPLITDVATMHTCQDCSSSDVA